MAALSSVHIRRFLWSSVTVSPTAQKKVRCTESKDVYAQKETCIFVGCSFTCSRVAFQCAVKSGVALEMLLADHGWPMARQMAVIATVAGLSRAFMHRLCSTRIEGAEVLHAALERPPGQVPAPVAASRASNCFVVLPLSAVVYPLKAVVCVNRTSEKTSSFPAYQSSITFCTHMANLLLGFVVFL